MARICVITEIWKSGKMANNSRILLKNPTPFLQSENKVIKILPEEIFDGFYYGDTIPKPSFEWHYDYIAIILKSSHALLKRNFGRQVGDGCITDLHIFHNCKNGWLI